MSWIEYLRTPNGRHYHDGNGRGRFEQIAGTVLHYADGDQLQPVDMRAQRVNTAALDGWRVTAASWHFAIGQPGDKTTDGWIGYGAGRGRHWLRFRLHGVGTTDGQQYSQLAGATYDRANLSRQNSYIDLADGQDRIYAGSVATWADVLPGVDLRWRLEGRRLKEEIVISEAARAQLQDNDPAAWLAFAFELDLSDIPAWRVGDYPKTADNGFDDRAHRIQMRDAAGALLAFMPIDYAYAAADPEGPRVRLRKRIYKRGEKYWLLVGAKIGALEALPAGDLILDPTLESQPAESTSKDTYIDATNPTTNYGTHGAFSINGSIPERRALIEFDLSSITGGSDCNSATLQLTTLYTGVNAVTINAYSLAAAVESWAELQATWNLYKTGNNWPGSAGGKTSGTDFEAGNIGTTTTPATTDTAYNISLTTSRVANWFGSPNTNYGIILESGSVACAHYSSNTATAADRPKLTIDYTLPSVDPADVDIGMTTDAVATLGSTNAQIAAAADVDIGMDTVSVTQGAIPPTMIRYDGNAYLETTGPKVTAILLATAATKWRLLESGGGVEAIGLSVERHKAYLTPQ